MTRIIVDGNGAITLGSFEAVFKTGSKASNPDTDDNFGESVVLNSDGTVLAIGTYLEDSNASGVNGNQSDNSAVDAGAVYVFVRSSGRWQQQAYLIASNADVDTWFGFATSLSSDGETLAIGARYENNNAAGVNGNQYGGTLVGSGAVYLY